MTHEHGSREFSHGVGCVVETFVLAYLGYYTLLTPFNQSVHLLFRKIVTLYVKISPHYYGLSTD